MIQINLMAGAADHAGVGAGFQGTVLAQRISKADSAPVFIRAAAAVSADLMEF